MSKRYNSLSLFLEFSLLVVGWICYFALLDATVTVSCAFLCRPCCRILGEIKRQATMQAAKRRGSQAQAISPIGVTGPAATFEKLRRPDQSVMTGGLISGSREAEALPAHVCAPEIASNARWRRQMIPMHGGTGR